MIWISYTFFIHSLLGYLQFFTIVHNAAVNGTSLHVDIITFWFLLDNCLKVGLMKLVVNFVRKCHTDFIFSFYLFISKNINLFILIGG